MEKEEKEKRENEPEMETKESKPETKKSEDKPKEEAKPEEKPKETGKDLLKKEREFVVPGDIIVTSLDYLPGRNCFREGDSIITKRLGVVHLENHVISVVPLSGVYVPRIGDMVIGEVEDIQSNGWVIKTDSPCNGHMPLAGVREFVRSGDDLSKYYSIGDIIYAKVSSINSQDIKLSMQDTRARKLIGGRIVTINPVKVPRLIGKQGSMISMINKKTGCRITVGQNGLVWIQGEKANVVIETMNLIEKESHTEGLTDKVSKILEKEAK